MICSVRVLWPCLLLTATLIFAVTLALPEQVAPPLQAIVSSTSWPLKLLLVIVADAVALLAALWLLVLWLLVEAPVDPPVVPGE